MLLNKNLAKNNWEKTTESPIGVQSFFTGFAVENNLLWRKRRINLILAIFLILQFEKLVYKNLVSEKFLEENEQRKWEWHAKEPGSILTLDLKIS